MKKIVLYLTVLIFITSLNSNAQNNGFLGKRVLFNLDCKIAPVFSSPTYFGQTEYLSADFTFSPGFEVILHKRGSLGIAVSYLNTKLTHYDESSYWYIPIYLPVRVYGGSLYYKQYLNKKSDYYQAPFGVYSLFRLDYFQYHSEYNNTHPVSDRILGFRAEMGVDYLVWNRIRFSWGVSLGITNVAFGLNVFDFSQNNTSLDVVAKQRISTNYIFHNKVGVSILLF
ncbi:MAG TPA: hypothetical protein PLI77_09575 [Bacteroidales bacterium]|nr:hypothetical protein [Bacteroidales bacterium]